MLVAALSVTIALVRNAGELAETLRDQRALVIVVVLAIVGGEVARLRLPSGRVAAPVAAAAALAFSLTAEVQGEPAFAVRAGVVTIVMGVALGIAATIRFVLRLRIGAHHMAARLIGVGLTATLARNVRIDGTSLIDLQIDDRVDRWLVALAMMLAALAGLLFEVLLSSAMRAERHQSRWPLAIRDEFEEALPLTLAVVASGPLIALAEPALGISAFVVALFPLALTHVAVRRYTANLATHRQTIVTLSRLTEKGRYTPPEHPERVARLSISMGRVLGLSLRDLRDLEFAALLHDLGQITLLEPIPGGATVLAAPADQQVIADKGADIVRQGEFLEEVVAIIETQTTPYRLLRELGQPVPLESRILKVANAFDDFTEGDSAPRAREAAMERINLGLGYEYDPEVVDALVRVLAAPSFDGGAGSRRVTFGRPVTPL